MFFAIRRDLGQTMHHQHWERERPVKACALRLPRKDNDSPQRIDPREPPQHEAPRGKHKAHNSTRAPFGVRGDALLWKAAGGGTCVGHNEGVLGFPRMLGGKLRMSHTEFSSSGKGGGSYQKQRSLTSISRSKPAGRSRQSDPWESKRKAYQTKDTGCVQRTSCEGCTS